MIFSCSTHKNENLIINIPFQLLHAKKTKNIINIPFESHIHIVSNQENASQVDL